MDTLFIGQNIIRLQCIDSTNNFASLLVLEKTRSNEKIPEGTLILANSQQKGKGQRGNSWESEPGKNLTVSYILSPTFLKPEQQFLLNKIFALAILDLLKHLKAEEACIKWPNDVFVKEKKIAGILIENSIRAGEITNSIVGIGLNINQEKFSAPNATSLKILFGKEFSPDICLNLLCSSVEARYLKLKADISSADSDYLHALYRLGRWSDFEIKEEIARARIKGISNHGHLILQYEDGKENSFDFKEVIFL